MSSVREHDLEEHIDALRELNKYREESAALRNEGFEALDAWLEQKAEPSSTKSLAITLTDRQRILLLKAYCERRDCSQVEKEEREKII